MAAAGPLTTAAMTPPCVRQDDSEGASPPPQLLASAAESYTSLRSLAAMARTAAPSSFSGLRGFATSDAELEIDDDPEGLRPPYPIGAVARPRNSRHATAVLCCARGRRGVACCHASARACAAGLAQPPCRCSLLSRNTHISRTRCEGDHPRLPLDLWHVPCMCSTGCMDRSRHTHVWAHAHTHAEPPAAGLWPRRPLPPRPPGAPAALLPTSPLPHCACHRHTGVPPTHPHPGAGYPMPEARVGGLAPNFKAAGERAVCAPALSECAHWWRYHVRLYHVRSGRWPEGWIVCACARARVLGGLDLLEMAGGGHQHVCVCGGGGSTRQAVAHIPLSP